MKKYELLSIIKPNFDAEEVDKIIAQLEEYVSNSYLAKEINDSYELLKVSLSELDAEVLLTAQNSDDPTIVVTNSSLMFLEKYGFIQKRVNGSHFIYSYPSKNRNIMLNIPMHSPIKPTYIDHIRECILEIEGDE